MSVEMSCSLLRRRADLFSPGESRRTLHILDGGLSSSHMAAGPCGLRPIPHDALLSSQIDDGGREAERGRRNQIIALSRPYWA